MKQIVSITLAALIFALVSCNTTTVADDPLDDPEPISGVDTDDIDTDIDSTAQLLLKYRTEGFIDANTYSITIVRPSDSTINQDDVEEQAKKRTLVSFQKYVRQRGTRVDTNINSALLNLINDHGTIKKIHDTEKSRIVFVFLVEKQNLKRYVDGL